MSDFPICANCNNLLVPERGHLFCPVCRTINESCCEGRAGYVPQVPEVSPPRVAREEPQLCLTCGAVHHPHHHCEGMEGL